MVKTKPPKALVYLMSMALVMVASVTGAPNTAAATERPWMDTSLPPEQRVELLLVEMTLDEKIGMLSGLTGDARGGYVGHVPAQPRLGIPALKMMDGRTGVGNGKTDVTHFPAPIAHSASWNPALVQQFGRAYGVEQRGKGTNVALGPTMNILRIPGWGRSFESYGEDPYLNGQIAAAAITGIQSQGVIANANMYAAQNQESGPGHTKNGRRVISANVDERTLHEIYLPAYETAIKQGQAGSVMCGYSRVNQTYACENEYLLRTVLRDEWNYRGFVLSDWGATHSTVPSAEAGLDMQMPGPKYFGEPLKAAVLAGEVSEALIDEKVRHILYSMFRLGLFDRENTGTPGAKVNTPAHALIARKIAEEGMVLLQNNGGALPIDGDAIDSVALVGPSALGPMIGGRGSGRVIPPYIVTPVDGFRERLGDSVEINHVRCVYGQVCEAENALLTDGAQIDQRHPNHSGYSFVAGLTQGAGDPGANQEGAGVTWTVDDAPDAGSATLTVRYANAPAATKSLTLYVGGAKIGQMSFPSTGSWSAWATVQQQIDLPADGTVTLRCDPGDNCGLNLDYLALSDPGTTPQEVDMLQTEVQLASRSDVAVVFVQDFQSESIDRVTLALQESQNRLVEAVVAANPNTIVVLNSGGPVLTPWRDKVPAIVESWYAGQEYGHAVAAVLLGDVNPSGKLPMTFPASDEQVPANTEAQYPGTPDNQVEYSERLNVGYRWYDAENQTPLFPFGHGLSYTTFSYDNLTVTPWPGEAHDQSGPVPTVRVSFDVTNTGDRRGADVAQVYVSHPASVGEPPRQLKGFEKVTLEPGQTKQVTIDLNWRAFAHWDVDTDAWAVASGSYGVLIGNSSRNLPLSTSLELTAS